MGMGTAEERFFETAFELAGEAKEENFQFPLVIVFTDQKNSVALVLTVNTLGHLLNPA